MTPMMVQWHAAKAAHPDALLFFRMGDFYELFGDDAVEASRVLELTLTSRDKNKDGGLPMAGVPHHALHGYLGRLIEQGYRVAVCDQMEDPRQAKGIVKRAVTRVVTPGVIMDDVQLDPGRNNYLCAVWPGLRGYGLAYGDVTTGELRATLASSLSAVLSELGRVEPREVLLPIASEPALGEGARRAGAEVTGLSVEDFDARATLAQRARGAGDEVQRALGALGRYLERTRPVGDLVVTDPEPYSLDDHVDLEETTFRNLEIVQTLVGGRRKGSLLGQMDRTATPMGARCLRRWLQRPLRRRDAIEARHDAVGELLKDAFARDEVRSALGRMYDVERLGGRVLAGLATPKDFAALRQSLGCLGQLRAALQALAAPRLVELGQTLDPLDDVRATLEEVLAEDPAQSPAEGRVIREGHDAEVDRLVATSRSGKGWILEYEGAQRAATGIASLKVRFNRVFGYYIEVTRANVHLVPPSYIRKQTISTGERFYTVELKEFETDVLTAEERRVAREQTLFEDLRTQLRESASRVLRTAARLAELDVLSTLAEVAHARGYVRPRLYDDGRLVLRGCRHPVVEAALPAGSFVPNDVEMDTAGHRVLLITGPNMAGKSTVMRQVALVVLMAQIGSFVPASEADIGLVDRIFTRVGASDDLSRGQSTFMVEMSETAFILKHATDRSLIVLDEIGRGTSTYDGLSIAWAVAEHIHDHIGARTLFATHYHELTELSRTREHVHNVHVAVREWNDEVVFLRKLQDGATGRSYGIQVGRLAGLPEQVLQRARDVLAGLEATDLAPDTDRPAAHHPGSARQMALFEGSLGGDAVASEIERAVARVDVDRTTPLEALRLVERWQRQLAKRSAS